MSDGLDPNANPDDGAGKQQQAEPPTQNLGGNAEEIFAKLDEIAEKRAEGIARKALESNGFVDDDLKGMLSQYREHRTTKATEHEKVAQALKQENEQLKSDALQAKLDAATVAAAGKLGIPTERVAYVIKMADLKDAIAKDGSVSSEAVEAALAKVLEDIPELKGEDSSGFKKVGASDSGGGKQDDVMATLLKAAGVTPKEGS